MLAFTITAVDSDIENVAYVLVESLKAQHYKVLSAEVASNPNVFGVSTLLVVIEP